jgi:hypothetical protein
MPEVDNALACSRKRSSPYGKLSSAARMRVKACAQELTPFATCDAERGIRTIAFSIGMPIPLGRCSPLVEGGT